MAGVRVGKVKAVELEGDHVRVEFKVDKSAKFGPDTGAAIKVKTLLGAMFVALEPAGRGQMKEKAEIPTSRTTSPYYVAEAFSGLAQRSEAINTQRLAKSLNTLGDLTKTTPKSFKAALSGLSDLSANVAKRDDQLNSLLRNTKKVSKVLGDRSGDPTTLMRNGDVLFRALAARRDSIHNLLVATSQLSIQLTGLVHDTRADLKPALDHLGRVVDVLNKNQDNLDNSLRLMAPFYKVFANTLSNGPGPRSTSRNLPPVGAPELGQGG